MEKYEMIDRLVESIGEEKVIQELSNYFSIDDIKGFYDSICREYELYKEDDEEENGWTEDQWLVLEAIDKEMVINNYNFKFDYVDDPNDWEDDDSLIWFRFEGKPTDEDEEKMNNLLNKYGLELNETQCLIDKTLYVYVNFK